MVHVVTGGAGYFGEILVRHLLGMGLSVRVFDLNPYEGEGASSVESVIGDVRSTEDVKKALKGASHVHHNIAQVPLAKNVNLFWEVNRDGTRNVLEASLHVKAEKVIY